jgi:hypothetical protein
MSSSRREFLVGAGIGGLAAGAAVAAPAEAVDDQVWLQQTLERYDGFGVKASGGPGDAACGAWLEDTLGGWGYDCAR